jgi:hypothetical protein
MVMAESQGLTCRKGAQLLHNFAGRDVLQALLPRANALL